MPSLKFLTLSHSSIHHLLNPVSVLYLTSFPDHIPNIKTSKMAYAQWVYMLIQSKIASGELVVKNASLNWYVTSNKVRSRIRLTLRAHPGASSTSTIIWMMRSPPTLSMLFRFLPTIQQASLRVAGLMPPLEQRVTLTSMWGTPGSATSTGTALGVPRPTRSPFPTSTTTTLSRPPVLT